MRLIGFRRPEFHDAPHHLGDVLVADLPGDLLSDEEALTERGLLRADHIGEFRDDADFLAGPQIPVIGLLAVGGDHADVSGVVEQVR